MKKSEIYRMAQLAILEDRRLSNDEKLDVIRELQDKESVALYVEETEAKKSLEEARQAEYKSHKATTAYSKPEQGVIGL